MHCAFAFVLFLLPITQAAPPPTAVTELQFLEVLNQDHVAMRALEDGLAQAEAARIRSTTLANPRLEFGFEHPESDPRQTTWALAWTPPVDGRLGLARAAADSRLEAARQHLAFDKVRLRRAVREAYAEWALSAERQEVLQGQVALLDSLADQVRRQAEAGETSGISSRRIDLELAEFRSGLSLAEAAVLRAQARARAWRPDLPEGVRPVRPALPVLPERQGTSERSDLQALRAEIRQAELEAKLGRRLFIFPEIQAGWQRLDDRGEVREGPVFGLAWSLPLFDRAQADRYEATRRRGIAEAQLTFLGARAKAEVEGSRAAYARLSAAAREAQAAIEGTSRMVEGATATFRAGEGSLTDLLDTLRAGRDALLRSIDSHGAALEAHRDLEVATGQPLVEGIP